MNSDADLAISQWTLPEGGTLLERIERMIRPTLFSGTFIHSPTALVGGLQYHLGGVQDTEELASLASVTPDDRVLDVCCFLGGPAVQLASEFGCHVTGIDINETVIMAATRIANLTGLNHLLEFGAADARNLPFPDGRFTILWCQGSVSHDEAWFQEFDRVLQPGGRLAITMDTRLPPDRWSLTAIAERVAAQGYTLLNADDLTARDIEFGWRSLDARLTENEAMYAEALGDAWVADAHRSFAEEIGLMQAGKWGNGRIVAQKNG